MKLQVKVKTLFILICLFFASCGDSKQPLSQENKIYEGRWTTTNDNYILIKDDGGCDCAIGGVKKTSGNFGWKTTVKIGGYNFNGANVFIKDSIMTIDLFGIKKKLKITQKPTKILEKWQMILDDITYIRE